ncbi:hypothetical protein FRC06_004697 [Ceratobasidium sp. 370]|nr:hypothetical protein FRC06_004697 [Ceratobasidium sp. 370]
MIRSYVLSTAAGSCLVALLAVALTVVWRRKQRWRRTRPWLAKLRAEAASKLEKEKERVAVVEHQEVVRKPVKDTLIGKVMGKEKLVVLPDTRSDGGSASGKRTKGRRKRGKESKPAARSAALSIPVSASHDADSEPRASSSTPKPDQQAPVERPISAPLSPPLSPRLIPLPLSPLLTITPAKVDPPALVLSGPTSPISTSVSVSATATELTATTPATSTSVSPAPASPAFNSSETTLPATTRSKLPAFPPASPLPPSLARKAPPLARRPTPTLALAPTSTLMPNINRKDSHTADRRKEPSRKGTVDEDSDELVGEFEFPTLSPWPVVGKQGDAGKRREREGRRVSDAGRDGRKTSDAGRSRKPSDTRKKAAASAANPKSTQLASLRGALEAARLREEEVAEERRMWAKKERELQIQVNQLAHQLQLATMFPGVQGYPGYVYGYGPVSPAPGPQPQAHPQVQPQSEFASPERSSPAPILIAVPPSDSPSVPGTAAPSQPYPHMHLPFPPPFPMLAQPLHGSPLSSGAVPPLHGSPIPMSMPPRGSPMPSPMCARPPVIATMPLPHGSLSPPQPHPSPFMLSHPWRGGSPMIGTTGPSSGVMAPGMNPSAGPAGMNAGMMHPIPGRQSNGSFVGSSRRGTPSTPSVGSVDDGVFGNSIVHPPPATPGSLKREREYDDEEEEGECSSEESDEDEDSDDDSVIFEDGSVSDSVNLSLHGDSKERDLVSRPVEIRIGEDAC